jgi:vacuolar-type H+-ATPase subunit C/Vma6
VSSYDSVDARARGLATHLLSAGEWNALADASDLPTLTSRLVQGREPLPLRGPATASDVERAARRLAGQRLALLARWCEQRPELLEVLFGDEDRRSLQALVRGALAAAPPDARLAATLPTPGLPLRALETLAAQPTIAAVAALLVAWRHPAAAALDSAPRRGPADLLLVEMALTRDFAGRALRAARRGDSVLRWHTQTVVDLENVLAALVLAEAPAEVELSALFVEGGRVSFTALDAVARAPTRLVALEKARAAFARTAFEEAFTQGEPSRLAQRLAALHRGALHRRARTDPLSSAPVLDYALRLREEVQRLQRLAWAVALDAPLAERLGEGYAR